MLRRVWEEFSCRLDVVRTRVARAVTFGNKLLPFASKFEICYGATKSCFSLD